MSLISMIGPFAIDTYLPSFPAMEAEFGVSRSLLTQSLGVYLAAFAIATLFWGPITDRFGRKSTILSGMFLYLLSSIGCALAEDYNQFLLFRAIQGTAVSGGLIAGRAMIRDVFDSFEARQVMSYVMFVFAIAPAIAPMIGAVLHDAFGWRSIFYFLTVFGLFTTLLAMLVAKETLTIENRQSLHPVQVTRVYINAIKHGRFQAIIFACGASFGGLFLFIAGSPTILLDFLALDSADFWMQFVPMVLGLMAGSIVSGKLSRHHCAKNMVSFGLFVMAVSVLLNVLFASVMSPSIFTIIIPLVGYSFATGIAIPAFTVMALDCFPKNRGTAAALQSFVQMMANAVVASLVVPMVTHSLLAFALAQLGFISVALLFWSKVVRTSRELS